MDEPVGDIRSMECAVLSDTHAERRIAKDVQLCTAVQSMTSVRLDPHRFYRSELNLRPLL